MGVSEELRAIRGIRKRVISEDNDELKAYQEYLEALAREAAGGLES
jgi:hypothetical protein